MKSRYIKVFSLWLKRKKGSNLELFSFGMALSLDQKVMQNVFYIRAQSGNPSSIWILFLHNFI